MSRPFRSPTAHVAEFVREAIPERLEYDHIIPVSRGGSNTARNIELRCEARNRRKSATV